MVARAPRLVGEARQAVAEELAGRYHDGASIRSLARESGRSYGCLLYTSPSPRDRQKSRMPSSA